MNRIFALTYLAAGIVLIGSARAHAQVAEATIPFDFVVQDGVLPAGTYQISRVSQNGILVRSLDGNFRAISTTYAANSQSAGKGRLVFTRYGNRYFLHEVLCSDWHINAVIPRSSREKRGRVEEAQLAGTQTVAANRVVAAK